MTQSFAASYLIVFLYWTGVLLGSLTILMIHNLTGGRWGNAIRPALEAMARCIPWLLLFFIPIALSLKTLYLWMDPHIMAHDELLKQKAFYLNAPFFAFRAVFCFFVWTALAYLVTGGIRFSENIAARKKQASGAGLVILTLTVTVCSVDWVMSLEPHWNSTIYGFIILIGQALSGFAFATALTIMFSLKKSSRGRLAPEVSGDLGTLLFVLVMLWAYVNISQFLILWSGNLPELVPWYVARSRGGWEVLSVFLALFHFAVPFFLLLMRPIKRDPKRLLAVAGLILFMRWADLFWLIKPVVSKQLAVQPADLLSMIAVGVPVTALIVRRLAKDSHD